MQESRQKELAKNTFIITLGRVSTQFVSFLLLPLYTSLLSSEEFGIVDFITTLVQLIVPIVSLMIDQSVFRYLLFSDTEEDKSKIISSAFYLLSFTCVLTVLIFWIFNIFYSYRYNIYILIIIIATAYSNFFLQIARGLKKTSKYALGSFICSVATIFLNVFCIALLKIGSVGMLFALFAGNALCSFFLFFNLSIKKYVKFSFASKSYICNELKYSLPLIPNQLSIWVMNCSDRIIVTLFLGISANGILAVSHKFLAIYFSFFNIFLLAWHETGSLHYYDKDRDDFFSDTIKKVLSIFSVLCIFIIAVLPLFFNLLVNQSYDESYYNVPIYLGAALLNVLIGVLGVIYVATKNTKEIAKTTFIAATLNIVFNIILIKKIGLYAASVSTLVGYLITLVYRMFDAQKYIKIKIDIKQIVTILIVLILSIFFYYLRNPVFSFAFCLSLFIFCCFACKDLLYSLLELLSKKFKLKKSVVISITVLFFVVFFSVGGLYCFKNFYKIPIQIQTVHKSIVYPIKQNNTIMFSSFGSDNFTCTGIAFDSKNTTFWIGDYGALNNQDIPMPRLIEVDENFKSVIRVINLKGSEFLDANLQGVAYDSRDDALWLAIGRSVVKINKEGKILFSIKSSFVANGICYDSVSDTLWVLGTSKFLVHIKKDGSVLNQFYFDYFAQDHLCLINGFLYITVGADYLGSNNFICKVDPKDGSIVSLYKALGSNSIEGISYNNKYVFVANDGFYHSDKIKKSYITVYSLSEFKEPF